MTDDFIVPKDPRLAFGMLLPSLRAKKIPKPAGDRPTHYLFWARNAIYHGLRVLNLRPGDNVLVPSYHCTSVVEPILQYGGAVKFYNVGLDLRPNLNEITSKIDAKTRAVLVIHYFGFPQSIVTIKDLCRAHGLFLIEDCAHVLKGRTEDGTILGATGDISIFSWRKFLPLYDGGQLVINNPALSLENRWQTGGMWFALKIAKNLIDKLLEDSDQALFVYLAKFSRFPSAWMRRDTGSQGSASRAAVVNSYDLNFDLASADLKMSALSRYILANTDLADVAAKRRRNYNLLAEGIGTLPGVKALYPALPADVVPWVFPLLSYAGENLHLRLRERGVPATNWSGVVHCSLPLDKYPASRFLYDNLIFLPVHQSLRDQDIDNMLAIVREAIGARATPNAKTINGGLSLSAL